MCSRIGARACMEPPARRGAWYAATFTERSLQRSECGPAPGSAAALHWCRRRQRIRSFGGLSPRLRPEDDSHVSSEASADLRLLQVCDAVGVVRVALVSARILRTQVRVPLEVQLGIEGLMPRMADDDVDVI